eukprot:2747233-Rhodomonas_salina.1
MKQRTASTTLWKFLLAALREVQMALSPAAGFHAPPPLQCVLLQPRNKTLPTPPSLGSREL